MTQTPDPYHTEQKDILTPQQEAISDQVRLGKLSMEISIALTREETLQGMLTSCTETLVHQLDAAFARIWILNEETNILELQASSGIYTHLDGAHARVPVGALKIGLIASERQPHLTNEVIGDPRVSNQEWARREGMVAFAGYPLLIGERLIGVMAIFARYSLNNAALQAMATIANGVALGIERMRMYQNLQDLNATLAVKVEQRTEVLHQLNIERKKAEREREMLISEQIAAQELERRRNEFMGMVVHELKTPITSLKGYAQLLYKRCLRTGDEQTAQFASRMDTQITKLTGLVDDFLDVTRMSEGRLQFVEDYFPFDALTAEIVQEIQLINERQTILQEGMTNKTLWGDRTRIGQVITNLLTNAMKYAPDAERILVKTFSDTHTVTLCVQDFGPGIPKTLQSKIFDPFYRIENNQQGTASGLGLGLHIAAEIIKRQEGQIWVESEEGKGATFCFTLPIEREHTF